MTTRPWMPLYVGDFIADTMHLGATETGIYLRLIMHCWQHGKIPRDDRQLALITHCDPRLWHQYRETVLGFFNVVDASTMHHKRVSKELRRCEEISNKRKAAAEQKHSKSGTNAEQLNTHARASSPSPSQREDSDPTGSARDIRGDLFGKGLATLAEITGKTPDSCRSLVGRWLKNVHDEAIHVLGAIENAERNRVADPVAWITRSLQSHMGGQNGKRTVHDAAREQLDKLRALDEPGPSGLRDGAGQNPVRLLPAR